MKKLLKKIWVFISLLWSKADVFIDKFAPIAIGIVEQIKKVNESTTGDIIESILSAVIPGKADDVFLGIVREYLRSYLPKILAGMHISQSIAAIEDPNEQLKAIIVAINMSPDEEKNAKYHTLSVLILNSISDGKLTFGESVLIAEYYYSNIYKKK